MTKDPFAEIEAAVISGVEDPFAAIEQEVLGSEDPFAEIEQDPNAGIPTTGGYDDWAKRAALEELKRRGIEGPQIDTHTKGYRDLAQSVNPVEAFLIKMGQGLTTVGRGLGLVEPVDETEKAAMKELSNIHPVASFAGEFAGETAPFIPAAIAAPAALPSGAAMAASTTALGALEGGVIAKGKGQDPTAGAVVGGALGLGGEAIAPVLNYLGRRVAWALGRRPGKQLLTKAGEPTPELMKYLEEAGLSFEDLSQSAVDYIKRYQHGYKPEQVVRGARAAQEGVPLTRGELRQTGDIKAKERLLAQESAAGRLRVYKEDQARAIQEKLQELAGNAPDATEFGETIKRALTEQDELLATQKRELYDKAAEYANKAEDIPVETSNIFKVAPDTKKMRRAYILDETGAKKLEDTLAYYEITAPPPRVLKNASEEDLADFVSEPLNLENFDDFRTALNTIASEHPSLNYLIQPIKQAADEEFTLVGEALNKLGEDDHTVRLLKKAWQKVAQRDVEFNPKTLAGKLVTKEKEMDFIPASQVYNRLMRKSVAPEHIRQLLRTTRKAPGGKEAIEKLQATTLLDMLNAGFAKSSDGVPVFDARAFIKRAETIGEEKLKEIFYSNPQVYKKLKNFLRIAEDVAQDKSAAFKDFTVANVAERIALFKFKLLGATLAGALKSVAAPATVRYAARKATKPTPEKIKAVRGYISRMYPGIASAIGIGALSAAQEENK